MEILTDKIGFPLVRVENVGSFNLWPVTKLQFERFLAEPNEFGDSWYEAVLRLNSRVSHQDFGLENYENLVITGILPREALSFARWFDEKFDLPTIEEWRAFYRTVKNADIPPSPTGLSRPAAAIWAKLAKMTSGLLDFALLDNGVVEWVRRNGSFAGLGCPRPHFLKNAWNPLVDLVRAINLSERISFFGFRLLKRETGDGAKN